MIQKSYYEEGFLYPSISFCIESPQVFVIFFKAFQKRHVRFQNLVSLRAWNARNSLKKSRAPSVFCTRNMHIHRAAIVVSAPCH